MTIWKTSAYEGTNNAAITAVQQNMDSLFLGTGASAVYTNNRHRGNTAGAFQNTAALYISPTILANDVLWWRGWFKTSITPDGNRQFVEWQTSAEAMVAAVGIDTAGRIRIRRDSSITVGTSITVTDPDTWYGVVWYVDTSDDSQTAMIFAGDGTYLETLTGIIGGGNPEVFREGSLSAQGDFTIFLDDTALANEEIALTGNVEDPPPWTPGDPYRISPYEGEDGAILTVEGASSHYRVWDSDAYYHVPGYDDGVCGRFVGQYCLVAPIPDNPNVIFWRGWIRFPVGAPESMNRIILELETTAPSIAKIAAVSIMMNGQWVIRGVDNIQSGKSVRRITPNEWYGVEWKIDRANGQQELRIYSDFGQLREVISGVCGTTNPNFFYEGCRQGRADFMIDFDDSFLHSELVQVDATVPEYVSNLEFQDSAYEDVAEPLEILYWDGTELVELEIYESK